MVYDKRYRGFSLPVPMIEEIEKHQIKDCNFIKMDIEGGEVTVIPNIKNYLKRNKPTLYLSLHPKSIKEKKNNSDMIIDVLKIYRNIFTGEGKKINLTDDFDKLLLKGEDHTLIATDLNWNFFNRLKFRITYYSRLYYRIKRIHSN